MFGASQATVGSANLPPERFLDRATECMERIQQVIISERNSTKVKLNRNQCIYLAVVLKSAIEESRKLYFSASSFEHQAECLQALKLLCRLASEVESFIHEHCCSDETWMQAALTSASVHVRVSSLGYHLKLCTEFLRKKNTLRAAWLTFTKLESLRMGGSPLPYSTSKAELDEVRNAALDKDTLLESLSRKAKTTSDIDQFRLATILCGRLKAIEALSTAGSQQQLNLERWIRVDRESLERSEMLGKGTSTTVYKAKWFGAVAVAEKVFPLQHLKDGEFERFQEEVSVLAQLSHPNIVSFLGYSVDERFCSAFLELMDGDLKLLIQQKLLEDETREAPFSIQVACDIMLQVAEGVHYIHQKGVVHGNLKPASILLKGSKDVDIDYVVAKVANFGLPKQNEVDNDPLVTIANNDGAVLGLHRYWMAPELALSRPIESTEDVDPSSFKSDVFSFGMLCFEILTGNAPFRNNANEVIKMTLDGIRPDLPAQCPQDLKSLIMHCWDPKPHIRPSFAKICEELRYIKCSLLQDMSWMSKPLLQDESRQSEKALALPKSVIRNFKGDYSSLQLLRQLGKGGSDSVIVYLSTWHRPKGAQEVTAQKMFIGYHFEDFENEVSIMAKLKHRNVVRLFCYATDRRSCSIVMERMDADLHYWIHQRGLDSSSSRGPFSENEAIHIMLQIAQGMEYVHEKNVVHRDLKSCNILVRNATKGGQLDVKVGDFGVSKQLKSRARVVLDENSSVGTYRWMAPELLRHSAVSKYINLFQCDVYSFGMVCYEIMAGKIPFHEMTNLSEVKEMVLSRNRPCLPEWTPDNLKTLVEKCWLEEANSRPSFPEIIKELKMCQELKSSIGI